MTASAQLFVAREATEAEAASIGASDRVMKVRWRVTLERSGAWAYRIGWDVQGREKRKRLLRYELGYTERTYGVELEQRLYTHILEVAGVGKIPVSFSLALESDCRPIHLQKYDDHFAWQAEAH